MGAFKSEASQRRHWAEAFTGGGREGTTLGKGGRGAGREKSKTRAFE